MDGYDEAVQGSAFCDIPPRPHRTVCIGRKSTGGVVLDPFAGSGTVGVAAAQNGRDYILIELNSEYIGIIKKRLMWVQTKF